MKICFVAQNIYPCLSKKYESKIIGGSELQQIFISKGLRARGYDVSIITEDFGQPDQEIIDNIKIYKSFKKQAGFFGIRYFYPRLYKIWQALIRADADIYYARAAGFLPGILAVLCYFLKKKYIFSGASDADFIPQMVNIPTLRDKLLYTYGLKRATAIIVQSTVQKKLLLKNYGLQCTVIPNFFESKPLPNETERKYILWVSTIRELKRPMHFIRLASAFPNEKFIMIGGSNKFEAGLFNKIMYECGKLNNLDFLGFQPFEKTEEYFEQSNVFINTSRYEGFPNTFLQAWSRGIPVVSYVDPDNIIKENSLGMVPKSEQELHSALRSFLNLLEWDSPKIKKYFEENHSTKVLSKYCSLLEKLT